MSNFFSMMRLAVFVTAAVGSSWLLAQEPEGAEKSAPAEVTAPAEAAANAEGPAATTEEPPHVPATENADTHGGGHHDPTDIGHGNGTAMIGSPIDFRFDLAIWTFVVFILLLIILGKFAWGPISQGLEKRERGIEDQIEQARLSMEKAAEQQRLYEARLAAAAEEARQIAVQARNEAEAAKEQMITEAKAAAQRERDRAVADIAAAKNVALREISEKSVNTAIKLASNIVKREIKPNDHAQLIREAMDNFPSAN